MTAMPTLGELKPAQSAMLILLGGGIWDAGKNAAAIETAKAFLAAGAVHSRIASSWAAR